MKKAIVTFTACYHCYCSTVSFTLVSFSAVRKVSIVIWKLIRAAFTLVSRFMWLLLECVNFDTDSDEPLTSRMPSQWAGTSSVQTLGSLPPCRALLAWTGPGGTGGPAAGKPWQSLLWRPPGWRRVHHSRPPCRSTGPPPTPRPPAVKIRRTQAPRAATKTSTTADTQRTLRRGSVPWTQPSPFTRLLLPVEERWLPRRILTASSGYDRTERWRSIWDRHSRA